MEILDKDSVHTPGLISILLRMITQFKTDKLFVSVVFLFLFFSFSVLEAHTFNPNNQEAEARGSL